jgi:release factor glutamine methyltransferase
VKTVGEWRLAARDPLREGGLESPALEADLLLRHVLGVTRSELLIHPDRILLPAEKRRLSRYLHRRVGREPLQYILGETDFRTLTLRTSPAALIPRPETEGLVEQVLAFLGKDPRGTVLDVGTGTGCIALSLAAEAPGLRVWASELSPEAARLARRNARALGLDQRVEIKVGNLTDPFDDHPGALAALVSNPPYVAAGEKSRLQPEVRDHEPDLALFAPGEGLGIYRKLIPRAEHLVEPGGLLALEIGEDQGNSLLELLNRRGGTWVEIRIEKDLAGRDRYALALRAG